MPNFVSTLNPKLINPNAVGFQDDELARRTLMHNRQLDFVRRVLNPNRYPRIESDPRLGPGDVATHQMGWTTIEDGPLAGKHIVYPNIVFDRRTRRLSWLDPREAVLHALQTGEYIAFDDPAQADYFSKHYKRGANPGRR